MIRTGNFQFPGKLRFDKRMDLNDKTQFSFLVGGHGLSLYFEPDDSRDSLVEDTAHSDLPPITLQTEQNIAFSGQMEQNLGRTAKSIIIFRPNFALIFCN